MLFIWQKVDVKKKKKKKKKKGGGGGGQHLKKKKESNIGSCPQVPVNKKTEIIDVLGE